MTTKPATASPAAVSTTFRPSRATGHSQAATRPADATVAVPARSQRSSVRPVERYGAGGDSKKAAPSAVTCHARTPGGRWLGGVRRLRGGAGDPRCALCLASAASVDGERGGAGDDEGESKIAPERHAGDNGIPWHRG
jgi:hypothetical protein